MTTTHVEPALLSPRRLLMLTMCLLLALIFASWHAHQATTEPPYMDPHWVTVTEGAIHKSLELPGESGPQVTLAAPVAGDVQVLLIEPGQRVEAGQVLLKITPVRAREH